MEAEMVEGRGKMKESKGFEQIDWNVRYNKIDKIDLNKRNDKLTGTTTDIDLHVSLGEKMYGGRRSTANFEWTLQMLVN